MNKYTFVKNLFKHVIPSLAVVLLCLFTTSCSSEEKNLSEDNADSTYDYEEVDRSTPFACTDGIENAFELCNSIIGIIPDESLLNVSEIVFAFHPYSISLKMYNSNNNLIRQGFCDYELGENSLNIYKEHSYRYAKEFLDDNGNVIMRCNGFDTTYYVYNEKGQVIEEATHSCYFDIIEELGYSILEEISYNKDGLASEDNINETVWKEIETAYDTLDYETSIYAYDYDEAGNLVKKTDKTDNNHWWETKYNYDENGNLTKETDYYDNEVVSETTYNYDNSLLKSKTYSSDDFSSEYEYIDGRLVSVK